ncbi:fructuronate reductase [Providencia rettgeri]|nr:fructuronate reductase [Providencia rettgeri]
MKNISNSTLNDTVILPRFDRHKLQSRIVHLGFGAFHRAHQALYTSELLDKENADWGICEVNLFGGEALIHSLRAQSHLYTVVEKGASNTKIKISGAVHESLHPNLDGIEAILEKMAEPQVAIVSMTVTEKGYCVDPATGQLDVKNSMVVHDLENPRAPKSMLGYIVMALRVRRERHLAPFTVLSCDNIQENGHVARSAILAFARLQDSELADWIEKNVTFPCTMVDRIVPAATEEMLSELATFVGIDDPCGIACEPFRQWVIEDNFVSGRPNWDLVGAQFVSDVVPYEEMKLRMLNGSHSFLAYLGYLAGYENISDTMTDMYFKKAAYDMMMFAQAPSLTMPEDTDLKAYAQSLIERFSNPSLKHRTWQIAMDGSQKIPQRFGGSLRYHLAQGGDLKWIALGIAGWIRYVSGVDEKGNLIDVCDPLLDTLKAIYDTHEQHVSIVPAILSIETIFPSDIGQNPQVISAVSNAYQSLLSMGAKATVAAL